MAGFGVGGKLFCISRSNSIGMYGPATVDGATGVGAISVIKDPGLKQEIIKSF